MKKTFVAVLHIKTYRESVKVYQLAGRVISAYSSKPEMFKDLADVVEQLSDENAKLDSLIRSKDGSKTKNVTIEDQSLNVYTILKEALILVNKIAKGDKATILLSGFDSNEEYTEHDVPEKPIIKRIVDGKTLQSAKIYADAVLYADRYKLEMSENPADTGSWKTVIDPASVFKLELGNLTRAVEVWFRITAGNCHGWGIASDAVGFIPR